MKRKWIFTGLAVSIAAAGLIFAYLAASRERASEAERDKPVVAESQVKRGANGEATIHLGLEAQKLLALKIATVAPSQWNSETKGYGRVLDPTPLAALTAELASDRAAAEASRLEFERLKTLSVENNASAHALQAAQATALRDRLQTDNAYQRLLATWGKSIAERKDLVDFVQSLVVQESALVRVDLPAGEILKTPPASARLFTVMDENRPMAAQFISSAPAIDPQSQGQGWFFLALTNQSRFLPGASVTAYLPDANEAMAGLEIPREAVVRFNGQAWIYRQSGEETFTRHEVRLDHPTANGWFLPEAVKSDARIVAGGAQMLLSEEQKSQIPTGN